MMSLSLLSSDQAHAYAVGQSSCPTPLLTLVSLPTAAGAVKTNGRIGLCSDQPRPIASRLRPPTPRPSSGHQAGEQFRGKAREVHRKVATGDRDR